MIKFLLFVLVQLKSQDHVVHDSPVSTNWNITATYYESKHESMVGLVIIITFKIN